MATKLQFRNSDTQHALRQYTLLGGNNELIDVGLIGPGEAATLDVSAGKSVVLEFAAEADVTLPLSIGPSSAMRPPYHRVRLRTSKRVAKGKWEPVSSDYIEPRGATDKRLTGPVRLEISEMPL